MHAIRVGVDHATRKATHAEEISNLWYPRPHTPDQVLGSELCKRRVCRLYKEGYSLRELATWFRISHETIRAILGDANVKRRLPRNKCGAQIGKEFITAGYIKVYAGVGFPGAPKNGWMLKHRLIMQRHIGRVLLPWEIVHHKDRDKQNNDIANLEILSRANHPTCIACPYYQYYVEQTGDTHLTTGL